MSGHHELGSRYRRLLACYPASHRARHEDEMVGVLLTAASPGQRHPSIREAANLAWGALKIRLRTGIDSASDPGWRDALSAFSVILPLFFLAQGACNLLLNVTSASLGTAFSPLPIPLVLTILILFRLRRTAALATAALMILFTALLVTRWPGDQNLPLTMYLISYIVLILGLEAVALAASPGPRRGFQILRSKHLSLIVLTGAAVTFLRYLETRNGSNADYLTVALIMVVAAGMTVTSALSRRILVLLAIPLYSYAVQGFLFNLIYLYLPPLALLAFAITAASRSAGSASRGAQLLAADEKYSQPS